MKRRRGRGIVGAAGTGLVLVCICVAFIIARPGAHRGQATATAAPDLGEQRSISLPTTAPEPTAMRTAEPTYAPPPTSTPWPTSSPWPTAVYGPPAGAEMIAAGVWRCPAGTEGARFIGSTESDKYHTLGHDTNIKAENRICFQDRDSAEAYHYQACEVCKP